ncbi:MAG: rhodanese-like domain-containing protein [Bacteroidota bacterium]
MADIKSLLNQENTSVVDVREPWEFLLGHVKGSVNIPLGKIQKRMDELKELPGPIVLCCASGNRSGQATAFLQSQGFTEVYNGGGWTQVKAAR